MANNLGGVMSNIVSLFARYRIPSHDSTRKKAWQLAKHALSLNSLFDDVRPVQLKHELIVEVPASSLFDSSAVEPSVTCSVTFNFNLDGQVSNLTFVIDGLRSLAERQELATSMLEEFRSTHSYTEVVPLIISAYTHFSDLGAISVLNARWSFRLSSPYETGWCDFYPRP
jgi:hypothetical protein